MKPDIYAAKKLVLWKPTFDLYKSSRWKIVQFTEKEVQGPKCRLFAGRILEVLSDRNMDFYMYVSHDSAVGEAAAS